MDVYILHSCIVPRSLMNKVKIPKSREQHLFKQSMFAVHNQTLLHSGVHSIILLILTDMQCLYGSNNTVSRKECLQAGGREQTDFHWLFSFSFFLP